MAKIYGQLESAQVENLAADPSNTPDGRTWYNTATNKVKTYFSSAVRAFVFEDTTQTLTNKTVDASSNTLSNIPDTALKTTLADANKVLVRNGSGAVTSAQVVDANIASGAAIAYSKLALTGAVVNGDLAGSIARSKVAAGTSNHVLINDGSGNVSSEAALAVTRGGTGQATANAGLNALLPSQTSQTNKYLKTDGTNTSWASATANLAVASKTANYTMTTSDDVILASASGGAFTVTLPSAGSTGKIYTIKKTDSSANAVSISGTVDGATSTKLLGQYNVLQIVDNGTNFSTVGLDPGPPGVRLVGTASPSAASSTTISGLDGNTDKNWKVVMRGAWTGADGAILSVRPNNDSTVGNYYGVTYLYYSGAPIGQTYGTTDTVYLARHAFGAGDNNILNMEIVVASASGVARTLFANTGYVLPTRPDAGWQFSGGGWTDTSANITSLVFDFGGGTFTGTINVYRNAY